MDFFNRCLGQNQLIMTQNVINIQALRRQNVDMRDVAGRFREIRIDRITINNQCIAEVQLGESLANLLSSWHPSSPPHQR